MSIRKLFALTLACLALLTLTAMPTSAAPYRPPRPVPSSITLHVTPATPGADVQRERGVEVAAFYPYSIRKYFNSSMAQYTVRFHVGYGEWAHGIQVFNGPYYSWSGYWCGYSSGCNITMTYSGFGSLLYQEVFGNASLYYL